MLEYGILNQILDVETLKNTNINTVLSNEMLQDIEVLYEEMAKLSEGSDFEDFTFSIGNNNIFRIPEATVEEGYLKAKGFIYNQDGEQIASLDVRKNSHYKNNESVETTIGFIGKYGEVVQIKYIKWLNGYNRTELLTENGASHLVITPLKKEVKVEQKSGDLFKYYQPSSDDEPNNL